MELSRRRLLGAIGAGVAVSGCTGDGDGSNGTPTDTDGSMDTPAESDDGMGSPTVGVRDHPEYGEILVDSEGMTLYMFDSDTEGEGASTCYGSCADNWPPLVVEDDPTAGDGVTADLSTFEREDGSTQVAAGGWPLYYFASDQNPGDANGQGIQDVWWVLDASGAPVKPDSTPTESDGGMY